MGTTIPILHIRRRLGRHLWGMPIEFGPDGWKMDALMAMPDGSQTHARIIITASPSPDLDFDPQQDNWWHASMSRNDGVPTYADLKLLHAAVWPDGWAYHVFAPGADHVNIHETALHLWGRPDGRQCLPNFGLLGTI